MKAVGYLRSLPITEEESLFDFEASLPEPLPRDVRVRVEAISVNPLDSVQRLRRESADGEPIILGWDVAGTVDAVGSAASKFRPGEEVYLSGSLRRPGGNAEYVLADERVVALRPRALSFTQAAALPLTTITAWEALFDRLRIDTSREPSDDAVLLIGAAGGVGSMAVQLLRARTALQVIATASRSESANWLRELGVEHVLDHTRSLSKQLREIDLPHVRYVFPLGHTLEHWREIVTCVEPEGEVVVVDNPQGIDVLQLRSKAAAFHMEMMWVKVIHGEERMGEIGEMLASVATLADEGKIKATATSDFGPICAANLKRAHQSIETGKTIGKITLTGF